MSKNIKISPKHGVNPTIPVCFWCGKDKNEIILLGKINNEDSEAPRNIIADYEPCDECKEQFSKGIHIIGISEEPKQPGMAPISKKQGCSLYPTGSMLVVSENFINNLFNKKNEELKQSVLKERKMLIDDSFVLKIIEDNKKIV